MEKSLGRCASVSVFLVTLLLVALVKANSFQNHFIPAQGPNTIAAGADHSVGIDVNGKLWSWGRNHVGQLGVGNETLEFTDTPALVANDNRFVFLTVGQHHNLAIDEDGDVWGWGWNFRGQLGLGDLEDRYTPVKLSHKFSTMCASGTHSLGLTVGGDLYSWGGNNRGQLGRSTGPIENPDIKKVDTSNQIQQVDCSGSYSAVVDVHGGLWTWGDNRLGQLGVDNSGTSHNKVSLDQKVKVVKTAPTYMFVIDELNQLWGWGNNQNSQLGIEMEEDTTDSPQLLSGDTQFIDLAVGSRCSLAWTEQGQVWTWGDNTFGVLGQGITERIVVPTPTKLDLKSPLSNIVIGSFHALAISNLSIASSTELWVWGGNNYGQLGLSDNTNREIPTPLMMCPKGNFIDAALSCEQCPTETWGTGRICEPCEQGTFCDQRGCTKCLNSYLDATFELPNGYVQLGTPYPVEVYRGGVPGPLRVDLLKNGSLIMNLDDHTSVEEDYFLELHDDDLVGHETYALRFWSKDQPGIKASTNEFEIDDKKLSLSLPYRLFYIEGSTLDIKWTFQGRNMEKVSFSLHINEEKADLIKQNVSISEGQIEWYIERKTNRISDKYQVEIVSEDFSLVRSVSEEFVIHQGKIFNVSINGLLDNEWIPTNQSFTLSFETNLVGYDIIVWFVPIDGNHSSVDIGTVPINDTHVEEQAAIPIECEGYLSLISTDLPQYHSISRIFEVDNKKISPLSLSLDQETLELTISYESTGNIDTVDVVVFHVREQTILHEERGLPNTGSVILNLLPFAELLEHNDHFTVTIKATEYQSVQSYEEIILKDGELVSGASSVRACLTWLLVSVSSAFLMLFVGKVN